MLCGFGDASHTSIAYTIHIFRTNLKPMCSVVVKVNSSVAFAISNCGEENGYEVVLVGHSLGAAVAAACCVQLRAGPGALRTARCVCYAPPATVDPNQAAEAASYITSVVHDDDCIPRMSILSLLELYKSLVSYNWLPRATGLVGKMRADPQQAWFLELGDNAFRKTLEEQLESIWKEQAGQLVEEVKKLEKPRQEAHPLSIPGFIVHLYRLGKLILSRQAQQVAKLNGFWVGWHSDLQWFTHVHTFWSGWEYIIIDS